ncbi:class F sortase [Cellulomonas pakistanensis]|uniref:Class F sortase n=1 Tax=Cellulomonas pakistanensis TaxID=992287 RepID=A0A919PBA9_9CELL|nr:class F sortase [Cellulomonas pakistanensis]GIG36496.1 class F sortase [Cellulomonas pakistanensis]
MTGARRRARAEVLCASLLLLAGCAAPAGGPAGAPATPGPAPATQAVAPGSAAAPGFQDPAPSATGSAPAAGVVPTRVSVPVLGVDSGLEHLGLQDDGRIRPPSDWQSAGWYDRGVVPGATGPAVIAGHVDSPTGPAVFWDLADLAPGDEIVVTLSDGSTRTFAVDRALHAAKADFPTSEVYRSTPTPQLRLITCAGDWDPATGHYEDNLVVFASQVA